MRVVYGTVWIGLLLMLSAWVHPHKAKLAPVRTPDIYLFNVDPEEAYRKFCSPDYVYGANEESFITRCPPLRYPDPRI